ncbi:MAG TPA: fasciclin domain-containing protein [Chitinophagaceae bacterium]
MSNILQIATADRNLNNFMKGLMAAGLEETLNGFGPFTILAPINLAFSKMAGSWEDLLKPANKAKLSDLIASHILKEKRLIKDFTNGRKLTTINGNELTVAVKNGEIWVNEARILTKDRQGSNGVIHSVDTVNVVLPAVVV